jgi:hypothetical protein
MGKWLLPDKVGLFNPAFRKYLRVGLTAAVISSTMMTARPVFAKDIGLEAGKKIQIKATMPVEERARQLRDLVDTTAALIDTNKVTRKRAANLLYRTAVHESGGLKYIQQLGGGPAVSYFQIEPSTAVDIVQRYAKTRPKVMEILEKTSGLTQKELLQLSKDDLAALLKRNNIFASSVARFKFRMNPEMIPEGLDAQSAYWGKYYQTTSDAKKMLKFRENNTAFDAQVKAAIKEKTLRKKKTAGLVNKVMDKKKVSHSIESIAEKTKHLFKRLVK